MKTGIGISWLDFKLGARMLIKYPALTLVGGLGMASAIAIGATSSEAYYTLMAPTLPLHQGERVVGIENWDAEAYDRERRSLHDFATWRDELKTVQDVGAFRTMARNLVAADGQAEPVNVAAMTASGFRVARVAPLLGRHLVAADEREGAPPVVVIGYDVWQTRFAGDPAVVGRTLRLGNTVHTVVGVMPEGFAFPVSDRYWIPLRADPSDYERREGPEIIVFGRLAPGATLDRAQAELTTIGLRTAATFPQTHERLRPRVVPYTALFFDDEARLVLHIVQLIISLLLVVVCVNVALLVYARTATRQGEIAVRNALGASRHRIVTQLFVEALVLSAGAAVVGLVLARLALGPVNAALAGELGSGLPFWVDFGLSAGTVVYVVGLVVLAAVIVGVVPAMNATGRRLQANLRQLGGGTGIQLGRTWTALIVAQVAFAVAVLPGAGFMVGTLVRYGIVEPGFAAEEFLTARLQIDRDSPPSAEAEAYQRELASRYGNLQTELVRRLEAEPGVSDVTFASGVPGADELTASVEVDGVSPPPGSVAGHQVRFLQVDVDFFDAFDVPVLTGRRFQPADLGDAASAVIVNRTFVREFLGGRNPLGRRVRQIDPTDPDAPPGRWYEIVGVVSNLPANALEPGLPEAKMYRPMAPGQVEPVTLALQVRGGAPAAFAGRLREITAALDPTLRLDEILPLDQVYWQDRLELRLGALAFGFMTLSVLLLSAAGIYALMSLTVVQRRREIGIRSALGAPPRQIVKAIFSRALGQLAIGIVVGVVAAVLLERLSGGGLMDGKGAVLLPGVAALMIAVGLLAAVGPARRGLRIEPTEALRES